MYAYELQLTPLVSCLLSSTQDVEALQQSESETAQDQIRDLEDSVKQLQQQLRDTESDLTHRSEELKYAEEESHRQKLSLQSRIQEREEELQKVRNQVRKKLFEKYLLGERPGGTQIIFCRYVPPRFSKVGSVKLIFFFFFLLETGVLGTSLH